MTTSLRRSAATRGARSARPRHRGACASLLHTRRPPARVAACLLARAPPRPAGGYAVTACFGPENAVVVGVGADAGATAYTACPGGVVDVGAAAVAARG